MFMDDKDKNKPKPPGMPPLPPGAMKPGMPPLPPGGKPPMPSMPASPSMPGMSPVPPAPFGAAAPGGFQQAAPQPPQKDDSESRRLQEEKDRLEAKINDMEKLLSQEKERALMATLKNQQDEALSSRVESSLKDIQEKMRRDRRDHEVEEERLGLKSKIKELETRLSQERETWMQTLKEQMSEREVQGRDVEGHFVYRLQEMERRWLDEKAQWQKEITAREDTIRSLKSSAEKLRDVEDEFRKVSLEKSMADREISKMRDDLARADREKASIEAYIKMIPEKEREIADLRAENASIKAREEKSALEAKYRDEKTVSEIGRLQAELGSIADRKNAEMNEAVRKETERFEVHIQEKEKAIADISGEKVRAISELVKLKGFVSRVQAINAVLEKERGQLKIEKMQLAQTMAAQVEEIRKLKQELDGIRDVHHKELESHSLAAKSEIERIKNSYKTELTGRHSDEMAEAARLHQEELARLSAEHQQELAQASASHQAEISRLENTRREEAAKAAASHQAAIGKISGEHQGELARITAERQAEFDSKISQLRMQYESSSEEEKSAVRRQLEASHASELSEARASASSAADTIVRLEAENRRLAAEAEVFERTIGARTKDFEERIARVEAEARRRDEAAEKAEARRAEAIVREENAQKTARESEGERQRVSAELAAIREKYSSLEAKTSAIVSSASRAAQELKDMNENLRLESENRSRFENEVLFLKQKVQQMEMQAQEAAAQLDAEAASAADTQAAAAEQAAADAARVEELSAEVERYKALEASFPERMKWAFKIRKEGSPE